MADTTGTDSLPLSATSLSRTKFSPTGHAAMLVSDIYATCGLQLFAVEFHWAILKCILVIYRFSNYTLKGDPVLG